MIFTLVFIVAFIILFNISINAIPVTYIFKDFLASDKQDTYRAILDMPLINYFGISDAKYAIFMGLFIFTIYVNSHKTYKFLAYISYVIFILFATYFIRIIILYTQLIEELVDGNSDIVHLEFTFAYPGAIILIVSAAILNTRNFIFFNIKDEITHKPIKVQRISDFEEDEEDYY